MMANMPDRLGYFLRGISESGDAEVSIGSEDLVEVVLDVVVEKQERANCSIRHRFGGCLLLLRFRHSKATRQAGRHHRQQPQLSLKLYPLIVVDDVVDDDERRRTSEIKIATMDDDDEGI